MSLAQAAAEAGYTTTDDEVEARIDRMVSDLGSAEKLTERQTANGYTDETFRSR